MRKRMLSLVLVLVMALALPVASQMQEAVDYDALYKIKAEGLAQQSQVMDLLSYLTDVSGPRLTGSPGARGAADWAMKKMNEWGLVNVKLEPWGPFGRGWVNERFSANVVSPTPYPLIGYPMAWTPGTDGPVTAEAVIVLVSSEADFEKYRGKLKGKLVLPTAPREVTPHYEADARKYTDAQLDEIARLPISNAVPGQQPQIPAQFAAQFADRQFAPKRTKFFQDEGVLALLEQGRGDDGTVFVQSGGSRDPKDPPSLPRVMLASEHYGRIYRTLQRNVPVSIELNVQNKFVDGDGMSFNIVGEIPGTDKAGEIVMLGGHFDSWHGGTGATDNAAGCAVMMEVVRILKTTGLKLRRTVRIGLWTGEEQGLLGSRAYVKEHFADSDGEKWILKPEHAKLSAYYNIDNGVGAVRGVYLQGNEAIGPTFARWIEPLKSLGVSTLTPRNTSGTDHLSFDAVGLPGFQFIQDTMDYDTRTHHSNMDVYERAQPQDMKQIATVVAFFVYQTANRDQLMPRKPMPKPRPAQQGPGGGPPRM